MILSWVMTYSLVVGALIVVAAVALNRVASTQKWPTRFIWAASLGAMVLWPIVGVLRALEPIPVSPLLPFSVTLPPVRVVAGPGAGSLTGAFDRALGLTWVVASALLLARLAADVVRLRRLKREWPMREIDGRSTRLTTDVGPAVVGLRSMELVLPEWILSLDAPLRALVLRHEEEHRAARDPYLLIGARLGVALMPWNPALWYAARRLRLAIELDCDARVLRADPSPQRYGMLLLTIAQRRGTAPTALSPMLSEPTTQLERRILAMRASRHRLARVTAVAGVLVAASALALACSVRNDTSPTAPKPSQVSIAGAGPTYVEFKLTKQATPLPGNRGPRYPDELRAASVEGTVIAQFVVNSDGTPDMNTFKVVKSTDPRFSSAVKDALAQTRFSPAEVDGRPVRQLLQMPYVFALSK